MNFLNGNRSKIVFVLDKNTVIFSLSIAFVLSKYNYFTSHLPTQVHKYYSECIYKESIGKYHCKPVVFINKRMKHVFSEKKSRL